MLVVEMVANRTRTKAFFDIDSLEECSENCGILLEGGKPREA